MKKIGIFIIKLLSRLPFWVLYRLSDFLSFVMYYTGIYRKKVVLENIKLALPNKSEKEIKKICRKFFTNFTDIMVESLKYFTISEKEITKRLKIKNNDLILNNKSKNIFILLAHYNNWEWATSYGKDINKEEVDFYGIYKPLNDKKMDAEVRKNRGRFNTKLIPLGGVMKVMMENSENIKRSIYGIVIDQSPTKKYINEYIKFMGIDTGISTHIEVIGKKINTGYVFAKIDRVKRGYYEVEFENIENKDNNHEGIMKIFHSNLEKQIQEKPENWLWTHRRWKHNKKD